MTRKYAYILYLLLFCRAACIYADDIKVYALIDDNQTIYAGQRFNLQIVIDGDNTPGVVDDAPLKPFSPSSPQVQDVSQSSTIIVNGQTTRNVIRRYLISYSLVSPSAGEYVIPPLNVEVAGKTYRTSPVPVKILEPETTNRIAIEASLSQNECYVGQPILLTVRWYVWQSVASRVSDYMFDVPAFESGDFLIDDVAIAPAPNQRTLKVSGEDVTINQRTVRYGGNDCVEVSFSKILIPLRPGAIDVGKIRVLCKINVSTSRFSFQSEYRSFGASTENLVVQARHLPEEGKPADFYGLIGDYDIKADATPVDVNVGDPITLRISIGNSPYLQPVQYPDLVAIKELADNFIISTEQSSPEIVQGRKIFTQTIRAKTDEVVRIPPIPLSCFNPQTGKYITAQSEPITLNVSPTKVLTLADVEGSAATPLGRRLDRVKEGISANYIGEELLVDMSFVLSRELFRLPIFIAWSLPLAIFIFSCIIRVILQDKEIKAANRRRKTAAKRLKAALKKINPADSNAKSQLVMAVKEYFAARFDRNTRSLTAEDCGRIISDNCGEGDAAQTISSIIEKCEAGRYSPIFVDFDKNWLIQVVKIIERVEKCVR